MRVAVALASGLLCGLCFPPFDLGPVALVALVPLLWTWRGARPLPAALYGFVFGIGCYGIVLEWIRYFGAVAIVPLVAVMALAIAVTGALVASFARRGIASPLLTAAVWVILEAFRGQAPLGGFPWADLGVSLHDIAPARALAGLGGTLLVTFAVVAFNGFALDGIVALRSQHTREAAMATIGLVAILVFVTIADVARYEPRATGSLRFAILQGDDEELPLALQTTQQLTDDHLALAARLRGKYDLVVFPESAVDTNPEFDPFLEDELTAIAAEHDTSVLVNARTPAGDGRSYNSNLLYEPSGRLQGIYSKQHLVPFGEYVPWRAELSFIGELRQIPYDYAAGDERVLFRVDGHEIGSVICFESAFGPLVRDFVRDGAEAIVVSTSNRSYRRSGNSEQHLALSQMRASETARPVLQASVSGISGVIDADGNVSDTTSLFEKAIVQGRITTMTGETPYIRFGEWIVLLSALGVLGATVFVVARHRRATSPAT
ncbi:MAG: apolipoprotein N-acyltransferase [Acidimicrobiia bacterium]